MIKRFTKVTLFPEEQNEIEKRMQAIEGLYLAKGINFEPMIYEYQKKMAKLLRQ